MIHIIGDSHALVFDGTKGVKCHWLGAATACNLWKKNLAVQDILNSNNGEFWFCFGEIDCRIHIYKAFRETKIMPVGFFADITAYNYVRYINTLTYHRDIKVMAIPPQGFQDNYFGYEYYASREHRDTFTSVVNMNIAQLCYDYKIPYIDIWEPGWGKLETIYSWPEEEFEEDKCHIKKDIARHYLEEYLENK